MEDSLSCHPVFPIMRTAGLDVATCTGMALYGDGEDRGKTIHLPSSTGFDRLHSVAALVERTLAVWKPDLVAVEGYAFCRNIHSFVVLVELGTVVRVVLHGLSVPWVEVPPTVLKKWTTGKGNATKDDMAHAVKTRWHYESPSHDVVDAFALAVMAHDLKMEGLLALKGVVQG